MQLVSAILTTHNRKRAIVERALVSILNQTYSNIEIIVVDDSTPDYYDRNNIKVLVAELTKNRAHYVRQKNNLGACAARNAGLKMAQGEFIAFLDDDDEWLPNKIEKQLLKFTNPETALVYCGNRTINDEDGSMKDGDNYYLIGNVFEKLIQKNYIGSTSFPLIRKRCLDAIGGFDLEMQAEQDYDTWLRLAQKYKVDCVPEPLVLYHIHKGGRISSNSKKRIAGIELINQKYEKYFYANDYVWWYRHMLLVPHYAKTGQIKKAFSTWFIAVNRYPTNIKNNIIYLLRIVTNLARYVISEICDS